MSPSKRIAPASLARLRWLVGSVLALGFALTSSGTALAQSNPSGQYRLEVNPVSGDCQDTATLDNKDILTVTKTGNQLGLSLPDMPTMKGKEQTRGKFRVRGADPSPRPDGMIRRFEATGRFDAGEVRMVLVAEYVKDGKIQCARSWNIAGKR